MYGILLFPLFVTWSQIHCLAGCLLCCICRILLGGGEWCALNQGINPGEKNPLCFFSCFPPIPWLDHSIVPQIIAPINSWFGAVVALTVEYDSNSEETDVEKQGKWGWHKIFILKLN